MQTKTQNSRAASSVAAKTIETPQPASAGDTTEIDYAPKKMTPRETLIVTLKLVVVAGLVFGLLWLAHVKLEN